jgi:hypothetical protein
VRVCCGQIAHWARLGVLIEEFRRFFEIYRTTAIGAAYRKMPKQKKLERHIFSSFRDFWAAASRELMLLLAFMVPGGNYQLYLRQKRIFFVRRRKRAGVFW